MREMFSDLDRRRFVQGSFAAAGALLLGPHAEGQQQAARSRQVPDYEFCAFIKFLQTLSYEEMANTIAELGFDGVEATVRKGGYILPEHAADELPKFAEVLDQHGLKITIMTTDIERVDQPHAEQTLRAAAALGIERYRLGFHTYDLKQPVLEQIEEYRPRFAEIASLNRELGIGALYQNHSGAQYLSATIWDLHSLIQEYPKEVIGSAFDIRHATVEASQAWPVFYNVMKPHIAALSVKDFRRDGHRIVNVPLGSGEIDPEFFQRIRQSDFSGPISVHVEYLEKEGISENVEALRQDLKTLRSWL